jgi:putative addiction module CopG family antidote
MAENTNINVSLTAELKRYLEAEVSDGEYSSISEVVREALRLHRKQKSEISYKRAFLLEVQEMVQNSLSSLRDGSYRDFESGEQLVNDLMGEDEE